MGTGKYAQKRAKVSELEHRNRNMTERPVKGSQTKSETDIPGSNYLLFIMDGQCFGLDILRVREILGSRSIVATTQCIPHLRGLINIRGELVPVVDIFLEHTSPPEENYTIIAMTGGMQIGIIAEKVLDACDIPDRDILHLAPANACVPSKIIAGMARVNDVDVILVDAGQILSEQDMRTACTRNDSNHTTA